LGQNLVHIKSIAFLQYKRFYFQYHNHHIYSEDTKFSNAR